jgi:hypothetical protein
MTVRWQAMFWSLTIIPGVVLQAGCNASAGSTVNAPGGGVTKRDTAVQHENCAIDSGSAEKIDANNDKRPDIFIVREGGREACRAVDLNFDGVIDSYTYNDAGGQVRRRENDYDRDGKIDEISVYKAGVIAQKDQATSVASRLDTWDFYQNGVLTRSERDSNGDGIIDQWWEYPNPSCPMIHADVNNDGRPDPGATVDYCKETGYVPPERQGPKGAASPDFKRQEALPTELENKDNPDSKTEPAKGEKGGAK